MADIVCKDVPRDNKHRRQRIELRKPEWSRYILDLIKAYGEETDDVLKQASLEDIIYELDLDRGSDINALSPERLKGKAP